jgi:DNA mismatch endonuclease, patch repair protein
MSLIRSRDTKPERIVRSILRRLKIRFRGHRRELPGKPDVVLLDQRVAIFVHGCFWHGHPSCKYARRPKSRLGYWGPKIAGNMKRDRRVAALLEENGWRVFVAWECETKDKEKLRQRLKRLLVRVRV